MSARIWEEPMTHVASADEMVPVPVFAYTVAEYDEQRPNGRRLLVHERCLFQEPDEDPQPITQRDAECAFDGRLTCAYCNEGIR